ncbi:MAG: dipeptidase [Coriobacteriia bacterium]|nr:dipeptidase [Coriobacteriia bacterium]
MCEEAVARVRERVHKLMPQAIEDLRELVAIPSIAFPGYDRAPVLEAAEATARLLGRVGCEVRFLEIPDAPPAVFGEIPGPPGAPTVLLYAHYDVQPEGDSGAWASPPFTLTERGGRLYGRGAADNKAGIVMHALALQALSGELGVSVKVLVEGEEETGRSGLEEHVKANPELYAADVVIVGDMGNWRTGEPTLTTSLRGVTDCVVEVRTLKAPVHSGTYGGPFPDALMALIRALDTLLDERGDVAIEGLRGTPWRGLEPDEAAMRHEAGALDGVSLIGTGTLGERLWTKPSVNVIGLDAPAVAGSRNALVHEARARVSLRVPPTVDPEEAQRLLMRHLERAVPWNAKVRVIPGATGRGFAANEGGPAYAKAREALRQAYGRDAVSLGSGGSIPLVSAFFEALPDAEIVLWGPEDGSCAIHAPNESVDPRELERAAAAEALLLASLVAD